VIEGSKHTGKDNFGWYRFIFGTGAAQYFTRAIKSTPHRRHGSASNAVILIGRSDLIRGSARIPVASARIGNGHS
jgi:hypothetical protein